MARLDAPLPDSHRASALLPVARGRQRKDHLDIGSPLRLIVFDDPDLIAALVHQRLRHVALGQERVHRAHAACPYQRAHEGLYSRALIGWGVHGVWGQRYSHRVGERREARRPWSPLIRARISCKS